MAVTLAEMVLLMEVLLALFGNETLVVISLLLPSFPLVAVVGLVLVFWFAFVPSWRRRLRRYLARAF